MLSTALALVLCATPTQESADEIMSRVQANFGPPARLAAVKNRVIQGTASFEGFGEPGTSKEILEAIGNVRIKSNLPGFGDFEEGASCGVVWEMHPMAGGALIKSGPDAMTRLRYYAILQHRPWKEIYGKAELLGSEKLAERDCYKLSLVPNAMMLAGDTPGGTRVDILDADKAKDIELPAADTWYVDAETLLPARIDMQLKNPMGQDVVMQLALSEWKAVDGIQYPHKRRSTVQGFHWNVGIESIQHDAEVPAGTFDLPPKVLDALNEVISYEEPEPEEIKLEVVEQRHAAVIRIQCPQAEISTQLAIALPEVMIHLTSTGAKVTGAPFTRYYTFGEEEIDFEAGIPVAEPIAAKGRIKPVELPGGTHVSAWHLGPYEELGRTHTRVMEYVAQEKLQIRGPSLEIYWTDPGMEPDPKKWRTQILLPVEEPKEE